MSILSYIESFYKEHSHTSHIAALQMVHAAGVTEGRASLMDDLRALFSPLVDQAEAVERLVKVGFERAEAAVMVFGKQDEELIPVHPATPGFVEIPVTTLGAVIGAGGGTGEPQIALVDFGGGLHAPVPETDAAPSSSEPTEP